MRRDFDVLTVISCFFVFYYPLNSEQSNLFIWIVGKMQIVL